MENQRMENNGLVLHTIKSRSEHFDRIDNLDEYLSEISGKSFVIAYLDYKVLIGTCENSKFSFCCNEIIEAKHLQQLRVFNNDMELLVWRSNDYLKGRLRTDSEGETTEVVDAHQVLFGTESKPEPLDSLYTKIFEDRGTELSLPFSGLTVDVKENRKNRVFIKTRNYIDYNKVQQAGYVDCRFLGFYKIDLDTETWIDLKESNNDYEKKK